MATLPQFAPKESRQGLLQIVPGVQRGLAGEHVARLPCDIAQLDALLGGGWPRGCLSEIYGTRSSGKTTLALHLLAAVTRRGEMGVWIDAADALHPLSLVAAGVELPRVLWVRPRTWQEALRSAEIALSSKGLALVVLDWGEHIPRVPSHAVWVRLQRAAARAHTALLLLTPQSLAGSFAALRVRLRAHAARWLHAGQCAVLEGFRAVAAIERNRVGPQRAQCGWEARWPVASGASWDG